MPDGIRDTCSHHWDLTSEENPACLRCGLRWLDSWYASYGRDSL